MFYTLNDNFALRSYSNKPFAILNKKRNQLTELSEFVFEALKLCDGSNDLAELPVYKKLLDHNIIKVLNEKKDPNLDYKKYNNKYVASAMWTITENCNLRCKHCFVIDKEKKCVEPTTQECFDIIDQFKECGVRSVTLFGGEPLVRKDFWDIVDYLTKQGISLSYIYTNATLVDENFLAKMKQRNLNPVFYVSFDGIGYHDFVRNHKGAEKEALEKIKLITSKGFKVICTLSLFDENAETILETVDVLSNIGVAIMRVQPIFPSKTWLRTGYKSISNEKYVKVGLDVLKKFCNEKLPMGISFLGWYGATKDGIKLPIDKDSHEKTTTCNFWKNSIFITAQGKVTPCPMIDFDKIFDPDKITEKPLKEILDEKKYLDIVNIDLEDINTDEKCTSCQWHSNCQNRGKTCLASTYFRTGSLKSRNHKAICAFFHTYAKEYEKVAKEYIESVASK